MDTTPKGNRLHIAIFGRTNVGKSSLLNYILGQDLAITSPVAGTTTDVVEKAAELLPLGPVLFLDTAGLDDRSALAELRIRKTGGVFNRADVILLVTEAGRWSRYGGGCARRGGQRRPLIAVVNKIDLESPSDEFMEMIAGKAGRVVALSAARAEGREAALGLLKRHLIEAALRILWPHRPSWEICCRRGPCPLGGPDRYAGPVKGRLILPQAIRDALTITPPAWSSRSTALRPCWPILKAPDLAVCDSQAILQVSADVPEEFCTTLSILFARQKQSRRCRRMCRGD